MSGGPSNAGKLNLFLFDETSGTYETTPAHVMSGENANDLLGESVAILGQGHVASYGYGVDELGPNVGRPYWGTLISLPDMDDAQVIERTPLEYEAEYGSGRFGIDFDLWDQDEDGAIDVVVGASYVSTDAVSLTRAGSGFVYRLPDVHAESTADTPIQE